MSTEVIKPFIKGVCVAFFLAEIGFTGLSPEWWAAMIAMNVALSL
jgi:hypothetical protein